MDSAPARDGAGGSAPAGNLGNLNGVFTSLTFSSHAGADDGTGTICPTSGKPFGFTLNNHQKSEVDRISVPYDTPTYNRLLN